MRFGCVAADGAGARSRDATLPRSCRCCRSVAEGARAFDAEDVDAAHPVRDRFALHADEGPGRRSSLGGAGQSSLPLPGHSGHSPRSRRTAVPQLFWKDRKFNRRSASNSASATHRQLGDSTRTSPAPHRNRRPFMPEARKTSVGWRSAGLWHERTRRATSGGLSTWDRPRFSRPAPNLQNRTMVTHLLRSTGNSG